MRERQQPASSTESLAATQRRELGEPGPPSRTLDGLAAAASAGAELASSETIRQQQPLPAAPGSGPRTVDPSGVALDDAGFAERYSFRSVLGEGGMGEVRLYHDARIGRDVAVKVLRRAAPRTDGARAARPPSDAEPRFLREVRVQGQLEHPSIVPVYDLGQGSDREPFFTMKRVRGSTLEDIVALLRARDPDTTARYSRRKLLTAFTQVCLAVDFAHSRGVVHRDLKPSNVMLGDFGEVYVLDWGIARVAGVPDLPGAGALEPVGSGDGARTAEGELLGTPGYMAPEQARGDADLDRRADVYALGTILFELLAQEPLHARTHVTAVLASTLAGPDARPSARAPGLEIPPELDAVCVRACALDRETRHATARALCDDVERFLDGDRDLARRRELADGHATRADEAARQALESTRADELPLRREAMREAGRALALDPGHSKATRTVLELLTRQPRSVPAEAVAAQEHSQRDTFVQAGRRGAVAYLAWMGIVPLYWLLGIRQPWMVVGGGVSIACAALLSYAIARFPGWRHPLGYATLAMGSLGTLLFGVTFAGPLFVLPMMVVGHTMAFSLQPGHWHRVLLLTSGILVVLVPSLAEWAGLLGPAYSWTSAGMLVHPGLTELPEIPTRLLLMVSAIGTIVMSVTFSGRMRDSLAAAERTLQVHAWHLRQLVPEELHAATSASTPPEDHCRISAALTR